MATFLISEIWSKRPFRHGVVTCAQEILLSTSQADAVPPSGMSPTDDRAPVYIPTQDPADHQLAHRLAETAGALLLALRSEPGHTNPSAEGDRRSDEFLLARLAADRPGDAVLSEESADDRSRLDARRVWIIDPLDGSREFGEAGRTDWAVHVALWIEGSLAAGAVALPAAGQTFSTWQTAPPCPDPEQLTLLASRSRPPALVGDLAERLSARIQPMGSAGAKAMAVLSGTGSAYVHAGGQYEWDSAAPVAVALAHGLRVRRLDGSAPRYNQPDPSLPDLAICRPSAAEELWDALDALTSHAGR
ncbi:3'(2'),5'-bisphosphate nucleotidase CysQ [Streptomyces sp. NBC_01525]|uniref:3'(2'),5'-bisphosphate nucleotidase CysQ n=1 Tax=Streptomyces sp. NBC_01525 TaxID=2903893 RepID=UPI00386BA1B8